MTQPLVESLRFLTIKDIEDISKRWQTPIFVYDEASLLAQARLALSFPAPYGLTVRFAMKANPHRYILNLFKQQGIAIDASSGYEAERAIKCGVDPAAILITSQELPRNLRGLVEQGVKFNACSLHQLEVYGQLFPESSVGVRLNPGLGSGSTQKVNVGGEFSSFGIWHEKINDILSLAKKYRLTIERLHTHIGSGSDPDVWSSVADISLKFATRFPDLNILNLGGGFKVGRMRDEKTADLQAIGSRVEASISNFYKETGKKLWLEIEPGAFLVANAGAIITTIQDITDTGPHGYHFLKLDAGMTEIVQPSFYGIRHPLVVATAEKRAYQAYVVVGHCCESGDVLSLSASSDDPGPLLLHSAFIGDRLVIEGAGAYCASESTHNYNSFPTPAAIVRKTDGSFRQISRGQTIDQMVEVEM